MGAMLAHVMKRPDLIVLDREQRLRSDLQCHAQRNLQETQALRHDTHTARFDGKCSPVRDRKHLNQNKSDLEAYEMTEDHQ